MKIAVLKFGGTSLANVKLMTNAMEKVITEIKEGYKVIVVVSAMAGVTDHLVSLTQEILKCKTLDHYGEYANVVTTGEQVSAGLFALLLQNAGIKARSWLGWQAGIITDNSLDDGNIIKVNADDIVNSFEAGFEVAVVTGFQGISLEKRISTLGRGGSDTTAILLAGALKADKCDIYTDVEGVFTADPRIVAKAQKFDLLSYDEMIEFSLAGAKVLQAKSAVLAKEYQVNLQVLSSFTSTKGTRINKEGKAKEITGIALSKDNNNSIAKVTLIGRNINNNPLLKEASEFIRANHIQIINEHLEPMKAVFSVNDEDKFDAVKLLHSACKLDQQYIYS